MTNIPIGKAGGELLLIAFSAAVLTGCGGAAVKKQNSFFTSGSREADQRASQRMAKAEELAGSGEGAGEKNVTKKSPAQGGATSPGGGQPGQAVKAEGKTSLFDRLGGEPGLSAIINDFIPRVLQDPRVNWDRKGVKRGGLFHHGPAVTWSPTPVNVAKLKQHMLQFLALATGGPAHYQGGEMKSVHADMQISNPEFDAAIGDIKASLDRLQVPNKEQKEFLAVIESTRPEIVTER